jgi:hypothetical protein
MLVINIILHNLEKKHIEDAIYPNIINLRTKYNPLSFDWNDKQIQDMISEGETAVEKFLKERDSDVN